jgi:hypothetical protein
LVCGIYQNPCTGEVVDKTYQPKYYPTSDSDVPGPIQELYWDPKIQTWYPKQQLTMNNSGNKWPINYKLLRSAIQPEAPVLSIVSSSLTNVDLAWTIKLNNCYPVTNFNIYVDNTLYKIIPNTSSYNTTLTDLSNGIHEIYIIGILSENLSPPSNIVIYNNVLISSP